MIGTAILFLSLRISFTYFFLLSTCIMSLVRVLEFVNYFHQQKLKNYIKSILYIYLTSLYFWCNCIPLNKSDHQDRRLFVWNLRIVCLYVCLSNSKIKFKSWETSLTTFTGLSIFIPSFFVSEPIHAILAGVTMHYSQYH